MPTNNELTLDDMKTLISFCVEVADRADILKPKIQAMGKFNEFEDYLIAKQRDALRIHDVLQRIRQDMLLMQQETLKVLYPQREK